ncbi:MAG: NifU family protein [Ignavibacteriales bacterium]|nr:NifU family protein [Ignavibacteriales bacterium]
MSNPLEEQVKTALEKIRPYLQADGGDVEFVEMTEDNIVYVRLKGACVGCPMSQMTLRAGVERSLMKDVPSIKRVEAVK